MVRAALQLCNSNETPGMYVSGAYSRRIFEYLRQALIGELPYPMTASGISLLTSDGSRHRPKHHAINGNQGTTLHGADLTLLPTTTEAANSVPGCAGPSPPPCAARTPGTWCNPAAAPPLLWPWATPRLQITDTAEQTVGGN